MTLHRTRPLRRKLCAVLVQSALLAGIALSTQAEEKMVRLKGTLSPKIAGSAKLGALDRKEELRFSLTLPVRNQAALDTLLHDIYTPGNPLYHRYLKTGEFAERFGPTQADYDAVIAFASKHGLRVAATHANRAVLELAGTPDVIEKTFGVHLLQFRERSGRIFHSPDLEPQVPATIAPLISGVVGLDDAVAAHPNLMAAATVGGKAISPNLIGSGPNSGVSPSDIKTAYNLNGLTQTGTGQSLALVELDGFTDSDIFAYEAKFNISRVEVGSFYLDGVTGTPTAPTPTVPYPLGPAEVTLDIELAIALAPGLNQIVVYEGKSFVTIFNRIASDNTSQQISCSWASYGIDSTVASATRNSENTALQQMALQGQSFYIATGDYGDQIASGLDANNNPIGFATGVADPPSQPFATAVGGTTLTTLTAGGAYKSESAWTGNKAAGGGNGGISAVWPLPSYQSAVVSTGSGGSSTFRNVPDVSLNADWTNSPYSIYVFGLWRNYGGTSCAAPLWAAYTALVNQQRAAIGHGTLGFANSTLYFLGNSGRSSFDFHDITTGNNGTYSAVIGYDNVTGWGSFNGGNLFNDLLVDATVLYVDGNFTGTPLGTQSSPFKTVTAAVNAASASAPTLIYIKGNTYLENFPSISKNIVFVNNGGGPATIGH